VLEWLHRQTGNLGRAGDVHARDYPAGGFGAVTGQILRERIDERQRARIAGDSRFPAGNP